MVLLKQGDLFPLDGAGRLGSEVIENTVNACNFGNDSVGYLVENGIGDLFNGSGHSILGVDGTDDCGPAFIAAFVLYADALDIGNCDEILPYGFCKTAVVKFFVKNLNSISIISSLKTEL